MSNEPTMTDKGVTASEARKAHYMDPAHAMDFDNLHLGHPPASKHTVGMLDLYVHVFGLDEIAGSTLPISMAVGVAAIWLTQIVGHGWANKASQLDLMASGIIGEVARLERESGRRKTHDLLVVTLDQRNHGQRRNNKDGLRFENNPKRLIHMATQIKGGKQDQQLVMELLPSFLFPHAERNVTDFMSVGISLGGHITWRLVREDPRIKVAVPIISTPSETLGDFLNRTDRYGAAAIVPPAVAEYFFTPSEPGVYADAKILCLHGGVDRVINYSLGHEWFPRIQAQAPAGHIVRHIQPDYGHVVTPDMVGRTAEWLWRWGLSE